MGKAVREKQTEKVLHYLLFHEDITQMDAMRFGCMRLGARIYDLRKAGYPIRSSFKKVVCADGRQAVVASYSLEKEA